MPTFNVMDNQTGFNENVSADNELKAVKFAAIAENYADRENVTIREAMQWLSSINSLDELNDYFGSAYAVEEMKL